MEFPYTTIVFYFIMNFYTALSFFTLRKVFIRHFHIFPTLLQLITTNPIILRSFCHHQNNNKCHFINQRRIKTCSLLNRRTVNNVLLQNNFLKNSNLIPNEITRRQKVGNSSNPFEP